MLKSGCNKMPAMMIAIVLIGVASAWANDFKDGISEFKDEPIATDDKLGDKDTNINYIITYAIGKAKASRYQAMRKIKEGLQTDQEDKKTDNQADKNARNAKKDLRLNYCDDKVDNNENSIVIEPGSKIDTVINVVVDK
ncbi:hypothetical protein KAR34_02805 [bacterium]|nr:hypothetical protein [bacterium]